MKGIIDMADIPYVSSLELVKQDIEKYGWEDDKEYFRRRLAWIFEQLNQSYDLELAREKQSLYFANSNYVEFMSEMGDPSEWAKL